MAAYAFAQLDDCLALQVFQPETRPHPQVGRRLTGAGDHPTSVEATDATVAGDTGSRHVAEHLLPTRLAARREVVQGLGAQGAETGPKVPGQLR